MLTHQLPEVLWASILVIPPHVELVHIFHHLKVELLSLDIKCHMDAFRDAFFELVPEVVNGTAMCDNTWTRTSSVSFSSTHPSHEPHDNEEPRLRQPHLGKVWHHLKSKLFDTHSCQSS